MKVLLFDIETGANEKAKSFVKPFDPDNPDHVKYGNAKREELRDEIVKQAMAIYYTTAEKLYALSPITGRILLISYCLIEDNGEPKVWYSALSPGVEERDLLVEFWNLVGDVSMDGGLLIGFNNKNFDIPFVVQRSWIHEVPTYPLMDGRWYRNWVIDLYEVWMLGSKSNVFKYVSNSLKSVSECLGIGTKSDDGKNFEKIFIKDRDKAVEYAINDINLTYRLYDRVKDFIRIKESYSSGKSTDEL